MGHLNHEGKIDLSFHRGAGIAVRQLSGIPIKNATATEVEESAARPCLILVREVFTQASVVEARDLADQESSSIQNSDAINHE